MKKLTRETVVSAALDLLDEVGLDAISTRQLARRLGIEQPSLYWHFRNKEELLVAMAEVAMTPHAEAPLPGEATDWREWLRENNRSFRRTLLMRRDGARLHAGTRPPAGQMGKIMRKVAYLVESGLTEHDAKMAMHATGRFTVGSVLEQQSDHPTVVDEVEPIDPEAAFEEGLSLIVDGLSNRARRSGDRP